MAYASMKYWRDGKVIRDAASLSPTVKHLGAIEGSECGWRLCTVPADRIATLVPLGQGQMPGEDAETAALRWSGIRNWVDELGSVNAALAHAPLVGVLDEAGMVQLVDGWRLLSLAILDHGMVEVPVLVEGDDKILPPLLKNEQMGMIRHALRPGAKSMPMPLIEVTGSVHMKPARSASLH